jgi:hypothetical protein
LVLPSSCVPQIAQAARPMPSQLLLEWGLGLLLGWRVVWQRVWPLSLLSAKWFEINGQNAQILCPDRPANGISSGASMLSSHPIAQ